MEFLVLVVPPGSSFARLHRRQEIHCETPDSFFRRMPRKPLTFSFLFFY